MSLFSRNRRRFRHGAIFISSSGTDPFRRRGSLMSTTAATTTATSTSAPLSRAPTDPQALLQRPLEILVILVIIMVLLHLSLALGLLAAELLLGEALLPHKLHDHVLLGPLALELQAVSALRLLHRAAELVLFVGAVAGQMLAVRLLRLLEGPAHRDYDVVQD